METRMVSTLVMGAGMSSAMSGGPATWLAALGLQGSRGRCAASQRVFPIPACAMQRRTTRGPVFGTAFSYVKVKPV